MNDSDVKLNDLKLLRQRESGIEVLNSRAVCEGLKSQEGGRGVFQVLNSYVELTDLKIMRDGDGESFAKSLGRMERVSVRDCTGVDRKLGTALLVWGKSEHSSSSSKVQLHVKDFEAQGGERNNVQVYGGSSVCLEDCQLQVSVQQSQCLLIVSVGTVVEALRCYASGSEMDL